MTNVTAGNGTSGLFDGLFEAMRRNVTTTAAWALNNGTNSTGGGTNATDGWNGLAGLLALVQEKQKSTPADPSSPALIGAGVGLGIAAALGLAYCCSRAAMRRDVENDAVAVRHNVENAVAVVLGTPVPTDPVIATGVPVGLEMAPLPPEREI